MCNDSPLPLLQNTFGNDHPRRPASFLPFEKSHLHLSFTRARRGSSLFLVGEQLTCLWSTQSLLHAATIAVRGKGNRQ